MLSWYKYLTRVTFKFTKIFNSLPFCLDSKRQLLYLKKSKIQYNVACLIYLFYTLAITLQGIFAFYFDNQLSSVNKYLYVLSVMMAYIFLLWVVNCRAMYNNIVYYVNNVFSFQNKLGFTIPVSVLTMPLLSKLNLLTAIGITFSCILFPIVFVYGFHWSHPCKPSLVGFQFLIYCQGNQGETGEGLLGTLVKVAVLSVNYVSLSIGFSLNTFYPTILLILCTHCITTYLQT